MKSVQQSQVDVPELVRAPELLRCLSISSSTLERWIRKGKFPKPRKLGRIRFWTRLEVDAWFREATVVPGYLP
jgi:predicted DNA-binding transcriptional regulator AlpA